MYLSPTEKRLLSHIYDYIRRRGGSPSYRWICGRMGWKSPNAPNWHLNSLARKGLIAWWPIEESELGRKIRLPGLDILVEFSGGPAGRLLKEALR